MAAGYRNVPPLRQNNAPDEQDGARIEYAWRKWSSQDEALRLRDRTIEENIRMLCGQQWAVWSPLFGRFLNPSEYLSEDERRWRQRPVFNRILPWFITNHARLTENPPILTFAPGPDAVDAALAETLDVVFKVLWREVGMTDAWDRAAAWLLVSGRVYIQSRIDLTKGEMQQWTGQAEVPLLDPTTGQPVLDEMGQPSLQMADGVPFNQQGEPLVHGILPGGEMIPLLDENGDPLKPYETREGQIVPDVLSALEVRGEWGPMPWHQKAWHEVTAFLPCETIYQATGVEVEPDVTGVATDNSGELQRLLFGDGNFGAADRGGVPSGTSLSATSERGLCEVKILWEKPCDFPGMEETPESPGGRLLMVTRHKVLRDTVRPARFRYTSPIRAFDFVRVPGRPHGTTPQESMNGPQRALNRGWAQILEHRNLVTNPIRIIDQGSGMGDIEITNEPDAGYVVNRRNGVPPLEFVAPPPLSADVWRTQGQLLDELLDIGNQKGTQGETPTEDASGELVKELRFNTDRLLGPTLRRSVDEFGRMAEDWQAILPVIWDREKVLAYAGDDNVARTLTVLPYMFQQGNVNVIPDAESMLPEGRGERQARVYKMWQDGVFGPPLTPDATAKYLELARFPHLSRTAKPGGRDLPTAERFLGALVAGEAAGNPQDQSGKGLPWYPWYDVAVHLNVLSGYMKAPEFLKLDPPIKAQLMIRWEFLSTIQAQQQAAQLQQAMALQGAMQGASGPSKGGKGPDAPPIAPGPPNLPQSAPAGASPVGSPS